MLDQDLQRLGYGGNAIPAPSAADAQADESAVGKQLGDFWATLGSKERLHLMFAWLSLAAADAQNGSNANFAIVTSPSNHEAIEKYQSQGGNILPLAIVGRRAGEPATDLLSRFLGWAQSWIASSRQAPQQGPRRLGAAFIVGALVVGGLLYHLTRRGTR